MTDRCANLIAVATLPNLVSCVRFALIPAVGWSIVNDLAMLSIGLFLVVVVSDFLDGIIARRSGQETRLGTLLDHGADATFVISITAVFAWLGLLPCLVTSRSWRTSSWFQVVTVLALLPVKKLSRPCLYHLTRN